MDIYFFVLVGRRWTDLGFNDFYCVNFFKLYVVYDDQRYQG